jgi:hypothetical protein
MLSTNAGSKAALSLVGPQPVRKTKTANPADSSLLARITERLPAGNGVFGKKQASTNFAFPFESQRRAIQEFGPEIR